MRSKSLSKAIIFGVCFSMMCSVIHASLRQADKTEEGGREGTTGDTLVMQGKISNNSRKFIGL